MQPAICHLEERVLERFEGNWCKGIIIPLAALAFALISVSAPSFASSRDTHSFTIAYARQQIPFKVAIYREGEGDLGYRAADARRLVIEIGPDDSTPGLIVGVADILLIVSGAKGEGDEPAPSTSVQYRLTGSSDWLGAVPVDLSQLETELSTSEIAMALLSSYLAKEGASEQGSSSLSISRAVATALGDCIVYREPPSYLLSGRDAIISRNYILLSDATGSLLTSVADTFNSAHKSYGLRLFIPLREGYDGSCIPEGFISFVVVLAREHASSTEVQADAASKPTFRHVGITFGSPAPPPPAPSHPKEAEVPQEKGLVRPPKFTGAARDNAAQAVQTAVVSDMVLIPEGKFLMGASASDNLAQRDEGPQHEVYLPAYYIDRTPVSNAQFRAFVLATGYKAQGIWQLYDAPDKGDYPVRGVSYIDATAYAKWAGKRLPTEAEWEKAMRGTDGRIYPWGNDFDHGRLAIGQLYEVGSFGSGASPYGVLDGAGLVWEWTASAYAPYPFEPNANGALLVLRGGAWMNDRASLRVTARWGEKPDAFAKSTGFRCAMDAAGQAGATGESMTTQSSDSALPEDVHF